MKRIFLLFALAASVATAQLSRELGNMLPINRNSDGGINYGFTSVLVSYDLLQLGDAYTTYLAFERAKRNGYEVTEANPLFRAVLERGDYGTFFAAKGGVMLVGNYLLNKFYNSGQRTEAYVTAILLNAAFGAIAYRNYQVAVRVGL